MRIPRRLRHVPRFLSDPRFRREAAAQPLRYLASWRDQHLGTYEDDTPSGVLHRYVESFPLSEIESQRETIISLAEHYVAHRFDLLGSGWVRVLYGRRCRGLEDRSYPACPPVRADPEGRWLGARIRRGNLNASQRIWRLVDPDYQPIDWQLDFKSGYRWSESAWYRASWFYELPPPGADIKVPWELGRMQHLPTLACAHALLGEAETPYSREFRNQILDFLATNPPRFGVNWSSSMDVALRAANWAVSLDLFQAAGAHFDTAFLELLHRALIEHALHLVGNLEWTERRNNHYLANVVGLLVTAAYLPSSPRSDQWLCFAVQELIREVQFQFQPDGTNFEASTAYHCLSASMVLHGTVLTLGLPEEKKAALRTFCHRDLKTRPRRDSSPLEFFPVPGAPVESPFPAWYWERLEKMAVFIEQILRPDHRIPLIGDNDSGYFLKLAPVFRKRTVNEARARYATLQRYSELPGEAVYWDEDTADHRDLLAAFSVLFERPDLEAQTLASSFTSHIFRQLAGGTRLSPAPPQQLSSAALSCIDEPGAPQSVQQLIDAQAASHRLVTRFAPGGEALTEGLTLRGWPNFGLYLYRSNRVYLCLRCSSEESPSDPAHAHNDELSLELWIDGRPLVRDPGSFFYQRLAGQRNRYRSVEAHFSPRLAGREPRSLSHDTFRFSSPARARCLHFTREAFIGRHDDYGVPVYRMVLVSAQEIQVIDAVISPTPVSFVVSDSSVPISPAYGVLLREKDST